MFWQQTKTDNQVYKKIQIASDDTNSEINKKENIV